MTEDERRLVLQEANHALRLARRYGGKFADDELEYASILLNEELPHHPGRSYRNRTVG